MWKNPMARYNPCNYSWPCQTGAVYTKVKTRQKVDKEELTSYIRPVGKVVMVFAHSSYSAGGEGKLAVAGNEGGGLRADSTGEVSTIRMTPL
jgi:hypothetical protein